ncbi:MAG: ABC transporter ATP-binding protein [Cellulosilyticaceae bacterium]
MLKQLFKTLPYLIIAWLFAAALALMDGFTFIKMMALADLAFSGTMDGFKQVAMELMFCAILLVPLAILVAISKAYYKKKANIILKSYYVKGVFDKNINEFQKENTAKFLSSLTNDFNTLDTNLIEGVYTVGQMTFNFLVGIWIMSTVTPWILLLAVGVVIFNIILSGVTSKPIANHTKERSDLFDGYTSYIKEVLGAFHIVKSNNLQERIQDNFYQKSKTVQDKGYIIDKLVSYMQAIEQGTVVISLFGVLLASGYMVIKGYITIGGALLIAQGIQKMIWPIFTLAETLPKLFTVKQLVGKVEEVLKDQERYEETVAISDFNHNIVLEDVSFAYEDNQILDHINLKLEKGGKYLIVGPSGGGKSTLLKLLRKYFNPTKGSILLDGQNLKDIKKKDYFLQVANVEQQVFIFEDTLKNNITLYKHYTDEEIWEAIEKAGLKEFVEQLPKGLETMIYDNGKNISGGERSRVVIARGLLAKAGIIFLDEAFAALDMGRAREIEQSILALEGITVINVSHVIFKETRNQYDKVLKVSHKKVEIA